MHFIMPTKLSDWKGYDVAGVVGVLAKDVNGQYRVVDAFDVDAVPSARQLAMNERFGDWVSEAGGLDEVRFDVFLMPRAATNDRRQLVTLLERSCGFQTDRQRAYAHAV